ncbi:hypothetical protein QW180_18170 [Vibrio sinaloensis]|nr:hypothetical protein [Vibrio sinaloensis]
MRAYAVVLKRSRFFVTYLTIAVLAQTLFLYYLSYGPAYLIGQLGMDELGFWSAVHHRCDGFLIDELSSSTNHRSLPYSHFTQRGATTHDTRFRPKYAVTVPMIVMTIGLTLVMTSCPSRALESLKEQAGVASGLYSAAQFGMSAAIAGGTVYSI